VRSTTSTSSADLFQQREKRINDVIALREPDQVPVMCIFGFQPDAYDDPFTSRFFGRILERLDYKQFRWPGHGVARSLSFQYVEDEYMKANEYDAFLSDPSDFMLRKYWPRIFGSLRVFENLFSIPGL
jgi:hypothetical protein